MFNSLRRAFGMIKVTQLKDEVLVEGVPGHFITGDISNIWRTSRLANFMFNKVTKNTFTVPNFFLIDLLYALERIITYKKKLGVSKKTAQDIIDALKESTWLGDIEKDHNDILNFDKLKLFWKTPLSFQTDFYNKYNYTVPRFRLNGYLLAGTPGSGKTLIGLTLGEMLESDFEIVICPANAVYNVWEKSILSEYKKPPTYWIADTGLPYKGEKILIFHYEALYKAVEMANQFKNKKTTIILDECHNLNNDEALRTMLFIDLCDKSESKNILWASGTPIKAMGSETIPLFRTIDPTFTDSLKIQYKKVYGKDAKKAIDILSNRLDIVTHKIEKHELGLMTPIIENYVVKAPGAEQFTLNKIKDEMTAFIIERVKYYKTNFSYYEKVFIQAVDIYRKQMRSTIEEKDLNMYLNLVKSFQKNKTGRFDKAETSYCNRFEKDFIMPALDKELKEKFQSAKSVVKYLELKVQGECLGRILGKRRMECVKLIAEHINYSELIETTTKKSLVFTSYVEVLEKAAEVTTALGLQPAVVYAKTNHMLTSIISGFEKDPNINPLIATFNSLSTAVPLVMADVEIMLNAPFRDYVFQQTVARINRLGADTQGTVYIALLDTGNQPNLSTRSVDILKWSQSQVSTIMGIDSPFQIEETGTIAYENLSLEQFSTSSLDPEDEFHISFEALVEKEFIL